MSKVKHPVCLIIRDGWGKNPDPKWDYANAVMQAKHPVADMLMATYPTTLIAASSFDVGLPEHTMGNSEVGHQNIGAGRVVDQESVAITKQVRSGEFNNNPEMNAAVNNAKSKGTNLHIFGLVSDAGVHGQLEHLYGVLKLCKLRGLDRVYLHAFTDGRDTSPTYGLRYLGEVEAQMKAIGVGTIATISGRYWAMDRDNRWDRVEKAYRAIAYGEGPRYATAQEAIQHYYDHPSESNMTGDEFVTPSIIAPQAHGSAVGVSAPVTVNANDSVIFYNYRGDRPREILKAFMVPDFKGFERGPKATLAASLYFVTMTAYEQGLPVHVAYPKPPKMVNILGDYLSVHGYKQFRCAETEKFPHVTFFFNDYREPPFPGEDRAIIPSPKVLPDGSPLSTYDQLPQMSAYGICDEVCKRIESNEYDVLVVNFANPDMVGHTGVLAAATKAVEIVDGCVGKVLESLKKVNGVAIITADHGNCEQMIDPVTGGPHTSHTTNPVELIIADDRFKGHKLRAGGRLADIAPTILHLIDLPQPKEMTGQSLLKTDVAEPKLM